METKTFEQHLTSHSVVTYRGVRLEDMSKEELIEAVKELGRLYDSQLQSALSMNATWSAICRARNR